MYKTKKWNILLLEMTRSKLILNVDKEILNVDKEIGMMSEVGHQALRNVSD